MDKLEKLNGKASRVKYAQSVGTPTSDQEPLLMKAYPDPSSGTANAAQVVSWKAGAMTCGEEVYPASAQICGCYEPSASQ